MMRQMRKWISAIVVGVVMATSVGAVQAGDWGRFYHYPYSSFPINYRKPFRSADFDTRRGYPQYPMYMAFPPYFRTDLHYPYLKQRKPGNRPHKHGQGNHYILDVF